MAYSPFSTDRKSILKGQISAIIQPDNTVRKLMGKDTDTQSITSFTDPVVFANSCRAVKLYILQLYNCLHAYTRDNVFFYTSNTTYNVGFMYWQRIPLPLLSSPSPLRLTGPDLSPGFPGVQSTEDPSSSPRRSGSGQHGDEGAGSPVQLPGQLQQAGLLPVLPEDSPDSTDTQHRDVNTDQWWTQV